MVEFTNTYDNTNLQPMMSGSTAKRACGHNNMSQ